MGVRTECSPGTALRPAARSRRCAAATASPSAVATAAWWLVAPRCVPDSSATCAVVPGPRRRSSAALAPPPLPPPWRCASCGPPSSCLLLHAAPCPTRAATGRPPALSYASPGECARSAALSRADRAWSTGSAWSAPAAPATADMLTAWVSMCPRSFMPAPLSGLRSRGWAGLPRSDALLVSPASGAHGACTLPVALLCMALTPAVDECPCCHCSGTVVGASATTWHEELARHTSRASALCSRGCTAALRC